jgi:hypothetical protein
MRFPYLKAARVKLQERRNACLRADYKSAEQYTAQFLEFAKADPVIRTVISELSIIVESKLGDIDKRLNRDQRRLELPLDRVECPAFH